MYSFNARAKIFEAESNKEAKIHEAKLAKELKIEEMRWKALSIASQSAQSTVNLTHLQRQGKSHSLVVWGLWICRSCTDQTLCVDAGPLSVVCERFGNGDRWRNTIETKEVTLVGAPFGWVLPCPPAKVEKSSDKE
jgi:MoaA/NifB/PqqE/SkfB family radical SAM enzyme